MSFLSVMLSSSLRDKKSLLVSEYFGFSESHLVISLTPWKGGGKLFGESHANNQPTSSPPGSSFSVPGHLLRRLQTRVFSVLLLLRRGKGYGKRKSFATLLQIRSRLEKSISGEEGKSKKIPPFPVLDLKEDFSLSLSLCYVYICNTYKQKGTVIPLVNCDSDFWSL